MNTYDVRMSSNEEIGRRVRESLGTQTQAGLAGLVGMTTDAMSRAVRGQRGFSSIELARIADVLDADIYWLITGEEDPMRVEIAARHNYDHDTGRHSNPGRSTDQQDLDAVTLAYRQAYARPFTEAPDIPATPGEMRAELGEGFVREFAERVELTLGIGVIRLPLLSTAYSLTIGGRRAVILPTAANWFRSNSDLAHELGHLALGHHNAGSGDPRHEAPANAFATELLLPATLVRAQPWDRMSGNEVARFLWDTGVSGMYLRNRLESFGLRASRDAQTVLDGKMPGSLRRHMDALGEPLTQQRGPFSVVRDPIDERMKEASQRRFPTDLIAAHREAVDARRINPATLAWMLDCGVSELFDDMTDASPTTSAELDFSDFES